MKTLVFTSPFTNHKVTVKADIFAKNSELVTAGFDTRFSHMTIVEDNTPGLDGVHLQEVENSWQAMVEFAVSKGYKLEVFDINELDARDAVVTAAIAGTIAGTRGSANVTGTGTTFTADLAPGDNIVINQITHTVATVDTDLAITVEGELAVDAAGDTAQKITKVAV